MRKKATDLIYKTFTFGVKETDDKDYTIRAVFSTSDEDRMGEVIDQKGWHLDTFLQNPVVLFGHKHYELPIGRVDEIGIVDGKLEGVIRFAVEEYEFAKTVYKLYKGGFMRAISVGFANLKYEFNQDTEQIILLENELYEVSCVNVPANAMALAKSAGIDTEPVAKVQTSLAEARKNAAQKTIDTLAGQIKEQVINELRADNTAKKSKVETPTVKGRKKPGPTAREINKAIRQLLKQKRTL